MPHNTRLIPALAMAAWILQACGTIDMSSDPGAPANIAQLRRVYQADSAANDSLSRALAYDGLKFVLQPGKSYAFNIVTPVTSDKLSLFVYQDGRLQSRGVYAATASGNQETFALQSDLSAAALYAVRLITQDSATAGNRIAHVGYGSVSLTEASALAVHLFMVGSLFNLPDASHKNAFADTMLSELTAIYAGYGITLTTSYELVNPASAPVTLDFGPSFFPLPGTRLPNTVHFYLVDSISQAGAHSFGVEILGFAPREAFDLSDDPDSRVILSARNNGPVALATTAAHELGHFFGLRHPTATSNDTAADGDQSNRDDGFASTPFCTDMVMAKKAAVSVQASGPWGKPYCLFVSGFPSSCPQNCDLTNLMFAWDCSQGTRSQRNLTPGQQSFLRKNVALMQSP